MGSSSSKERHIETDKINLLQQHLSEFLEKHFKLDSNSYVMYNDFIAHFYTYLCNQKVHISIFELSNCIFDLLEQELKNKYNASQRPEGVSIFLSNIKCKMNMIHNYSYIHGLKLTTSVQSAFS